jgi:hypothetical protein
MRTVSRHWESRVRVVLAWLLAVGLFVSNAAHSGPGTIYTVTSAADDAVGVSCAATPSQCNTLRDAVFSASSGSDSITFSALFNSPQTITLTGGEILISHSVTITGPGANLLAISGNQVSRIFRVASGTVLTLGGATLRDGLAGDVGGAIVSDGGLSLSFCVVTGNKAPGSNTGGGVYEAGGSTIIFGCTFDNNSAGTGAGIEVINATATITNCTFSGNVASSNGGAISFRPFTGIQTLRVRNTTIAYNRSPGAGGIFVDSSNASVTAAATQINNTLFGNNVGASVATGGVNSATVTSGGFNLASDGGGGFLVGANDQINVDPRLGPLSLNGASTPTHALLGGSPALDAGKNSGPPPLDQRTAPRPFVISGITPPGGDSSDIGAVEMQAIIVTNNNYAGAGSLDAAITTANSNGNSLDDIIFASPPFDRPQTIELGGALPDITSNVTINGPGANLLTVERDFLIPTEFGIFNVPGSGLNVAINGMTISNGSRALGGGIQSNSNLSLAGVNVTGNRASAGGGVFLYLSNGVFTDSTFSDNTAHEGGGIEFDGDNGHALRLSNSTVSGNVENSTCKGAGISHFSASGQSTLQVVSSTITRNVSTGAFAGCTGGIATVASGGTPTTTLRNSIVGNNAGSDLAAFTADAMGGTATMTSLGFNLASDSGGGFLTATGDQTNVDPKLGPLSLNAGTTPTHAPLGGSPALDKGNSSGRTTDQRGAVRAFDIPTLVASSGGDNADIGAVEMQAIIVSNTLAEGTNNCNLISCTLRQAINTANTSTSAFNDIIFASPLFNAPQTIDLTSALPDISSNVTVNGPGADLLTLTRDAAAPNFPIFRVPGFGLNVAINGMTISNGNNANEGGGGVESYSNLALANVFVTGNYSASSGGGVALNAGNSTFTNSTFKNNTSSIYGGGLFIGGNSNLDLRGCTVSGNSTVNGGGGIAVITKSAGINATANIVNSTIVDNAPGGIESDGVGGGVATALLRNSIIALNATNNLVESGAGASFSEGFNLSNSFDGITTRGSDITALPRLAPLNYYGGPTPTHALLDGSPALDAGDSSGATSDQRDFGFLRPVNLQIFGSPPGDAADIGAWEAQSRDLLFINGFESD